MRKPKSYTAGLGSVKLLVVACVMYHSTASPPAPPNQSKTLNSLKSCALLINELQGNLVDGIGTNEFLELKAVCSDAADKPGDATLYGHRVVLISAKTTEGGSGAIVGVIKLNNHRLSSDGFFTIGGKYKNSFLEKINAWTQHGPLGTAIPTPKKSISSSHFSVVIRDGKSKPLKNYFMPSKKDVASNDMVVPYAIGILRVPEGQIKQTEQSKIDLIDRKFETPLTPELERIITDQLIDLVVFNQHVQINKCSLFNRIAPEYAGKEKYILRGYSRTKLPTSTTTSTGSRTNTPTDDDANNLCTAPSRTGGNVNTNSNTGATTQPPQSTTASNTRRKRGTTKGDKRNPPRQPSMADFLQRPSVVNTPTPPARGIQGATIRPSGQAAGGGQRPREPMTNAHSSSPSLTVSPVCRRSEHIPSRSGGTATPVNPPAATGGSTAQIASVSTNDGTGDQGIIRYSISRCTDLSKGFYPEGFQMTSASPHAENLCDCTLPFIMHPYASELYDAIATQTNIPTTMAGPEELPGGCMVDAGIGGIQEVTDESEKRFSEKVVNTLLSYKLSHELSVLTRLSNTEQGAQPLEEVEQMERALQNRAASTNPVLATNNNGSPSRQTVSVAKEVELNNAYKIMLDHVTKHQSDKVPIQFLKDNKDDNLKLKYWLEYLPNSRQPSNSKFRCKLCHAGKHLSTLHSRIHSNIFADDEGTSFPNKEQFRNRVRDHVTKQLHRELLQQEEIQKHKTLEKALEVQRMAAFEKLGKEKEATAKMMMTVWQEVKMYLPFNSHRKIIELFEKLELHSLRFNHHIDRMSATRMAAHMSKQLHRKFLTYLTSIDRPISLLLDTGVDAQGNDYMSVEFQLGEDEAPRLFFYRLIPLGVDVTARGYLNALKEALDKDSREFGVPDLWNYLKRNLVAVTTDGAATFSGNDNGFGVILSQELFGDKQRIFRTHCAAHRLQLATRHAVDGIPELAHFESQVKAISVFYNQQHAKNLAHINELAKTMNRPLRSISYIFPTRWCTNAELVINRLMANMPLLMIDIPCIAADATFSASTRAEAAGLANIVSNLNFHATLYYLADIIDNLKFYSNQLQQAGNILIGKGHYYEDIMNGFKVLERENGVLTTNFLSNLKCQRDIHQTNFVPLLRHGDTVDNIWEKFDAKLRCKWTYDVKDSAIPQLDMQRVNIVGSETRSQVVAESATPGSFSTLRRKILDKFQEEFTRYFPEDEIYKSFDVLHGMNFNKENMIARLYGVNEIGTLAERFNLPRQETVNEYRNFMYALGNSPQYQEWKTQSPKKMWPSLLKHTGFTLGINFAKLVRIALVIAPSTASVERTFSILKHAKSPRRSSLTASHLEDIMRINMNGPDNLELVPIIDFVLSWRGHQTGSAPYKRRNTESVDKQAVIPAKLALTTQQGQLQANEQQRHQREREQAEREEHEIAADQLQQNSPLIFLDDEPEEALSADDLLDNPGIFNYEL